MTQSRQFATASTTSLAISVFLAQLAQAQAPSSPLTLKLDDKPQTTIKTQVRQVLLDVVVTDGKNHPITGLKREEFLVYEDGKPQKLASFQAHASADCSTESAATPLELPALPPNTFLNITAGREDLPLNVILYDVLNTPITDQPFARRDIQKFLSNKPPGSRYAIFVLSDKLHLIQGVTDSEAELVAAMNSGDAGSQSPALGVRPANTVSPSDILRDSGLVPNFPGPMAMIDRLEHLNGIGESYYLGRRIGITLQAFGELARFLSGVSGRKNLLWLSGSFPIGVFPGGDPLDPFARAVDFSPELRQTTNQLTLSQVAVYPVDIRGLTVNPVYSSGNNRNYSQDSMENDRRNFFNQLTAEHDAMDRIAEFSGGQAFYETNGFAQALQTATDDGSNYYTLSYSPTNTNFDGGLRKIRVGIAEKHYHLSYRRNYFADDDFTLTQRAAHAPLEKADAVMQRGSPLEHELIFSLHARATNFPTPVTPQKRKELAQFPGFSKVKKWDAVKTQNYELDFSLLQKQVSFLVFHDGVRHGSLEFRYAAYDEDSKLLYYGTSLGESTVAAEQADQAHTGFYRTRQILEIPANTVWLRVGIRDTVDGRVGSMEVPLPLRTETVAANAPAAR